MMIMIMLTTNWNKTGLLVVDGLIIRTIVVSLKFHVYLSSTLLFVSLINCIESLDMHACLDWWGCVDILCRTRRSFLNLL